MEKYRFTLEIYEGMNSRYRCPNAECGKGKTFTRYIDNETGEYIADHVGRCSRESNCCYHYTPRQYFQDNGFPYATILPRQHYCKKIIALQPKPFSLIDIAVFKQSLQVGKCVLEISGTNRFVHYLIGLFGERITSRLIENYFIGTSKLWSGATVFWQIDILGKIRSGKIMLYNAETGKRVKEPFNHISWVHSVLKLQEYNLGQCFFGVHLLNGNNKAVALVESEKTAIIASVYFPQFIWLAAGSLSNINVEKCSVLKGRDVVLFPDINGYEKWNLKAREFGFSISNLLEDKSNDIERKHGLDLADYLIQFNYRDDFNKSG